MHKIKRSMTPFVKWAGGKTQLLNHIRKQYQTELATKITSYCEPFVGGGAVLFDILPKYNFSEVLINDVNAELMNCYEHIKSKPDALLDELQALQSTFHNLESEECSALYYNKRQRFNYLRANNKPDSYLEKSVLFIFLNKTCFNGLFRVNNKGVFNVPFGANKNPNICDRENIQKISQVLQSVQIKCGDYQACLAFADSQTLFYIDPPYRPISKSSSFNSYSQLAFNDKQQIALAQFVHELHQKGASFILSNSDPKNIDPQDNFFDELYCNYNILRVPAKRIINCKSHVRGSSITELLITNF